MKLRRVEINGFKSFGRRTVLEFPEGISAIVGPNGSGKCVTGDTQVLLGDGSTSRIDTLVNGHLDKAAFMEDGLMAPGNGIEVLSLGKDLRVHKRSVQAFVKREAPRELVKIKTRSGREVTSTPYHPLFVLHDGKVEAVQADALAEGVRIAVPRNIRLPESNKTFTELLDLITAKDGVYVPFSVEMKAAVCRMRGKTTWAQVAEKAGLSRIAIKGFLDGQAINFSNYVKLLRALKVPDDEIINRIPAVKAKNYGKTCKVPWRNSPELARLLGYLLAEGRFPPKSDQIWFVNGDDKVVSDYVDCLIKCLGLCPTVNEYKSNTYDVLAYSKPARVVLQKLGMAVGGTAGKSVTNLFFRHAGEREIAGLLNGLYCGDGYVGESCIEITTKSDALAGAIERALLRLGIVARMKRVIKTATNSGFSGVYTKITFYNVEEFRAFADKVELVHPEKAERLRKLLGKESNPNIDLIEANDLVKRAVKEQGINVKRTKKIFPKLDAYVYKQCLPSRSGIRDLTSNLFGNSKTSLLLKTLCSSDIFWDEISSIERIEPREPWVYDLCVREDHNFIANNVFVHNSNVIDAICFALGYPSRNLRAAKAQELIHSGKAGNVPHAKVILVFEKSGEVFEIHRKVDRTGKSVYKLNDVTTSLDDLHDTLTKHSIPKEGFNIVMQNDVTKFIEIRPLERRKVLDQLSGISGYEEKKKRALDELAVVERRISDTNLILSEKKGYLEEIGKDREQAVKYQGMQDELKRSKSIYLYSALYDLENNAGESEKRMGEVDKQKDIKVIELSRIEEEIESIQDKLEKITKSMITSSAGEGGKIKGEISGFKAAIEKKQEEVQFLKGEITGLEERKKENAQRQRELKVEIKEKEAEIAKQKAEVDKVSKSLAAKERERDDKTKEFDNSELIALEKERKTLSESIFEAKKSLTLIDKELDISGKRESEIAESVSGKKAILKSLEGELAEMGKNITKLGAEAERIIKATKELEEAKAKLSQLFQEFARCESEIKTIERMEARIGESEAMKFVVANKDRGYIGQVSELGTAPEKYKVALEAAAGDRSKCLVVDDDKAAQFYIEVLRKEKIGRATFIPLNKIHGAETKEMKGEGVLGYAKDLIKCEVKYQKVFDFVFGDTLVVKDIDAARKVGIGTIKMATLDGDLVSAGGAMTGGYYQKAAVTFSSTTEKRKRLDEIKKEISELNDKKEKLERSLAGKDKINVGVMQERKSNLEDKMKSARDEIISLDKELAEIEPKRKELTAKKTELSKTIAKQEKELAGVEGKMNADAFNEMKSVLQAMDGELHDLKDHRFELQSRENSLKAEIDGMKAKIKDIDHQTDEVDQSISKFKNKIQDSIDQITKSGQKLKELEEKHTVLTADSRKMFQEQERLNQLVKELGEKRGGLEAELEKLKNEHNELEIKKAKTDTKLEEVRASIQEIEPPSKEDMKGANINQLKRRVKELETELGAIGEVNLRAVGMYDELEKQFKEISEKNEMLYREKEKIYDLIETIEEKKKSIFFDSFYKVKDHFSQIISELYPSTEGNLLLENESDPFNSGLIIEVKPRGREGMNIDSLSGGEKTLTAIAFLMATQSVTPSPFYILDEVDASLDQENVLRLVRFLKNRKQSQFILISHNPETIKNMDSVIGVHMQNGVSQIVGVDMQSVEA